MVNALDAVERGRESYAASAWAKAYESLSAAERDAGLGAEDLELLARSAYMLGRDDEYVESLERAHRAHVKDDRTLAAARCAYWVGFTHYFNGEAAPATGWFARCERLLGDRDCVERGYLLIPVFVGQMAEGDFETGHATAAQARAIGERFGDSDLVAMAAMDQGYAKLALGEMGEGRRLVDETMVAVSSGELSPIVAGLVYCNTISVCQRTYELRRAQEWTAALTRWCEQQPEMVAHNGICLVHRAEVMTLGGAWPEALEELRRLSELESSGPINSDALARAAYQRGEVLRLRGEFGEAEAAYRDASGLGLEPQPGLALLRLAQGDAEAAGGTVRRAVSEAAEPLGRATLLPAYVEIMLALGEVEAAVDGARQLENIAERHRSDALDAMAAQAEASAALADGRADDTLGAARRAWRAWENLRAPYEGARARVLVALACRSLGDEDSALLELEAACDAFDRLGATQDANAARALADPTSRDTHGLTDRELEVLRLAAFGKSNREIAEALSISEHTAARHLQNIFAKLGVSSRAAAGAFAFEHGLV